MTRLFALLAALLLAAAAPPPSPLDRVADDYVRLSLAIGQHDPDYVDAYYGPPAWAAEAKRAKRPLAALAARVAATRAALSAARKRRASADDTRRARFLEAQLVAAATRLRMLRGDKLAFADEAEGLYGVRPTLRPLAAYDPVLARVAALVPGVGPLWRRVDAFETRFDIPPARRAAVLAAATAECRRRTAGWIAPPPGERFTLSYVTGKPWSGYNWYDGGLKSRIEINTDLPTRMPRAVDLGCHEGYPGHHLLNALREERLVKRRGWVEFTVLPLYSPLGLIAEGTANYGIELAFPGDDQLAFERRALYPLAGLDPVGAARLAALAQARKGLAGARFTIAADYLDGRIDRAAAIERTQRYLLLSPARAAQSIDFTERYRSYVINYGYGLDMARATVERAGPGAAARWAAFEALIAGPSVPADLVQPAALPAAIAPL